MRILEPFSYFPQHSSAISGFGGGDQAPDPRYCFHTHYEDLGQGRVTYRVKMIGARATKGELTLRVHAHKAGSNSDISLVAGAKKLLDSIGEAELGVCVELSVCVAAVKGVHYALYGYFSEPSDLQVDDIVISIAEAEKRDFESLPEIKATSRFAVTGVENLGYLYSTVLPSLDRPISQDCTLEQVGGVVSIDNRAPLDGWRSQIALAALESYGLLQTGTIGAVEGTSPEGLGDALQQQGCAVLNGEVLAELKLQRASDESVQGASCDFVLSYELNEPTSDASHRTRLIYDRMSHLMDGGLAVFVLRYFEGASNTALDKQFATRNEIGQWALRLIGAGHDVAQLAFVSSSQRLIDSDGSTPFVLIVRCGQ